MKLLQCFLILFLFASCSDETADKEAENVRPTSLPFPLIKNYELSKKDLQKLEVPSIKAKFVKIKPGEFMMGSPRQEEGRESDETRHKVQISEGFYISKFETTVQEWNSLASIKHYNQFELANTDKELLIPLYNTLLSHPTLKNEVSRSAKEDVQRIIQSEESSNLFGLKALIDLETCWSKLGLNFKKKVAGSLTLSVKEYSTLLNKLLDNQNHLPINQVSYTQAVAFCHKLTEEAHKKDLLPKKMIYRLPTEAEWEFACRAGNQGVCGLGDGKTLSGLNANLDGGMDEYIIGSESTLINRGKLVPVGNKLKRFPPNSWGIFDMHGNVMEWCYDFYGKYPEDKVVNPIGPLHGKKRVLRGGSFYRTAFECRSANRESVDPSWRGSEIGFRVVLGFPLR